VDWIHLPQDSATKKIIRKTAEVRDFSLFQEDILLKIYTTETTDLTLERSKKLNCFAIIFVSALQ
jgi:predicted DNA-binding helix-hairpin-helix protein